MAGKSDSGSSDEVKDGGLKKGPWSADEDRKLIDYIKKHGYGRWRTLPKNAGLRRCGKSCRLRWTNYLRPDIKRGSFTSEEEDTIIHLHSILGNKWSSIAARLPGRTDNEIKNYWNTHIKKRLYKMGIDPVTHTPCAVAPLEQLSPFITHNLDLLRMLGSDINLSTFAASHLFPRTKTQQLAVSPQNPNNSSDELFQSHIQSLIATHQLQTLNQNISPNPNPFASSRDCDVSNSWHSENPIAHSGDFFGSFQSMIEADKTYHDAKYDDVALSMPGLIGTVDSGSIARYREGCSIGTEEERGSSYRSRSSSFIFDMENESYVNSIM